MPRTGRYACPSGGANSTRTPSSRTGRRSSNFSSRTSAVVATTSGSRVTSGSLRLLIGVKKMRTGPSHRSAGSCGRPRRPPASRLGDPAEFPLHLRPVDEVGRGTSPHGCGTPAHAVRRSPRCRRVLAEGDVPGAHLRTEAFRRTSRSAAARSATVNTPSSLRFRYIRLPIPQRSPDRSVVHHLPPVRGGQPIDAGHLRAVLAPSKGAAWERACFPNLVASLARILSSPIPTEQDSLVRACTARRSSAANCSGSSVYAPTKHSSQPHTSTTTGNARSVSITSVDAASYAAGSDGRKTASGQRFAPPAPACPSARRTRVPRTTRWQPPAVVASDRPSHRPPPATPAARDDAGSRPRR